MLDKQVLTDTQGIPMGVFIPMKTWENITLQYPSIELFDGDIPQWEKDFIDRRLNRAQHHPEYLKPVEMLLEAL